MNVILIYMDDQGYGDTSFTNKYSKFQTPNIDSIAEDGIAFTDAHCSSAVCTPSRYGILTGRYNWRTRLKSGVMEAEDDCLIVENRTTLGNLFKRNGFYTMMIGKWHLGMKFSGEFGNRNWEDPILEGPFDRGFDYFYGIPASMNFGLLTYIENNKAIEPATVFTAKKPINKAIDDFHFMPPYEKTMALDHCEYSSQEPIEIAPSFKDEETLEILTGKALQKIRMCKIENKPFFLYIALNSPHKPVCPSKMFHETSGAGRYGDFMLESDYQVGRILDCLKELDIEEETMVIFSSDNGPEVTYIKRKEKFDHDSTGGFRGGKRDIYEGGHRVPLFIKYPPLIKAGRICEEPVCQTDLLATFAELLQNPLGENEGEDSVSLLKVLESEQYEKGFRGAVVHHSCGGYFAIRKGDWKLNLVKGSGAEFTNQSHDEKMGYELYNIHQDPEEKEDLYGMNEKISDELVTCISDIVKNGRSTPGTKKDNDTKNDWKQLFWMK